MITEATLRKMEALAEGGACDSARAVPELCAEVRRLREALRGLVEAAHQYDDAKAHEVGLCDAVTQAKAVSGG